MRWYVLLVMTAVCGCYAVPSKHDIEPVDQAETGIEPGSDADVEGTDAGGGSDSGGDELDADVAEMDAAADSGPSSSDGGGVSDEGGADAETSVCGSCSDAGAPQCKVETKQCVACLADDAGACHGKLCSSLNTCIECRANKDCTNPAASLCEMGTGTCVACIDGNDGQCSHITDKNVCAAGQCVQCTKDKADACTMGGAQFVCDPTSRACDFQRKLHSKTLCNACVSASDTGCKAKADCVSNNECQPGQACVDVPAGAGKKVCQQLPSGDPCPAPYTKLTDSVVASADGPAVKVCSFATATTCLAHSHYRVQRCGTVSSDPNQDLPGSGDDQKCGEPNLADGYCVYSDAFKQYLCTVPCNASSKDCPNQVVCDTLPTPDRCTL